MSSASNHEDRKNDSATLVVSKTPVAPSTVTVNVGVPGNIRKLVLDANATVKDALRASELDARGYDVRMNGSPVQLDSRLVDGQTILLLRPVVGNR